MLWVHNNHFGASSGILIVTAASLYFINRGFCQYDMSLIVRKPDFRICENKDADQLRGNREADQRLCFRYIDSTIPLLPIYEISSL